MRDFIQSMVGGEIAGIGGICWGLGLCRQTGSRVRAAGDGQGVWDEAAIEAESFSVYKYS